MTSTSTKRLLCAMSGGVDSSVAALLLRDAGYEVVGMTALLFGDASAAGPCCGREGADSAAAVCRALGIEHRRIDLSDFFESRVIDRFLSEYEHGRTPNPCSDCNRFVKFDKFFEYAAQWDCAQLATGHYARIVDEPVRQAPAPADIKGVQAGAPAPPLPLLAVAADPAKDQSYFLACLPPERLSRILFPLGHLTKTQVRELAAAAQLPTAARAESQDVCFMANKTGLAELLTWHQGAPPQPGPIVDEAGRILGEHAGAAHFTVGQRKGLGLGGGSEGLVVHRIDPVSNTVVVAQREAHAVTALKLADFVDMAPGLWRPGEEVAVRSRYRQPLWPARVEEPADGAPAVIPLEPQYGAARGQWCVGYRDDVVLFGGIIDEIEYQQ
jgi:tRNA-specific 2-thiouridylase